MDVIEFPIECSLHTLYISVWPNGDRVQIACQDGGIARISRVDNTNLPELPAGYQYATAFDVAIIIDGEPIPIVQANGYILASFISRHDNPQYDILFWDETTGKWLILKAFQLGPDGKPVVFPLDPANPDDLRKILSGARLLKVTFPPREEATVNFTGILVLVQR